MKRPRIAVLAVALGLAGTVALESLQRGRDVDAMADAARNFLGSLSTAQRAQTTFAFDSEERSRHHFIPPEVFERHGFVYKDMNSEQKVRAQDLLRSGLSQTGYLTAQQIMEVEGILGVLVEGEGRQFARDQEAYWVSVFGTPSTGGTWGWRWEGHHLSLHFTIVDGEMTVSTPTFLGANPATVPNGARRGLRALKEQEDTAREAARIAGRESTGRGDLQRCRADERGDGSRPYRRPARSHRDTGVGALIWATGPAYGCDRLVHLDHGRRYRGPPSRCGGRRGNRERPFCVGWSDRAGCGGLLPRTGPQLLDRIRQYAGGSEPHPRGISGLRW